MFYSSVNIVFSDNTFRAIQYTDTDTAEENGICKSNRTSKRNGQSEAKKREKIVEGCI
ncbi:hypothetical protein GCM10010992_25770 [Cloacibacterium rupense]|uniref:Uncharacterized protein n=1 Tax=Cloacibacterium rupense TaxID=517423 RepID=A0ABQ2NND4_9FLAO|nr:hypothetical protein GCM10010992_25770 [Cloacibacterium rupense]